MNLCLVSLQAVLLAFIVVQYHYINEVEAIKHLNAPASNWFSSIENKFENVQTEEDLKAPQQVVIRKEEAPKRKKKIKKHKKKVAAKHEQVRHQPHQQRLYAGVDQEKQEFSKRVARKNHKKREKKRTNQRQFVKMSQKESNSSESDEVKRRQPVDIIVHIKMND